MMSSTLCLIHNRAFKRVVSVLIPPNPEERALRPSSGLVDDRRLVLGPGVTVWIFSSARLGRAPPRFSAAAGLLFSQHQRNVNQQRRQAGQDGVRGARA